MASQAVNEVLEAERLAKERTDAAKAEAADILRRADEDSAAEGESIVSEAADKKRKILDAAHKNAEERLNEARKAARDEADGILRNSGKMTEEAVRTVLKIIGCGGD